MTNNNQNTLEKLKEEARSALAECESLASLEEWRINYLGRRGAISTVMGSLGGLDQDSRRTLGKASNDLKILLQDEYEDKVQEVSVSQNAENQVTGIDVTLPGRNPPQGSFHPTTLIVREIAAAFAPMGFRVVEGPEVELDTYNFQKLNIPADHPARDMWNSLWVDYPNDPDLRPFLLRTHTSPMQIRVMEQETPPIRVIVPGKAFRYEATDATHEWQFTQIEGLAIDKGIGFADLKGTLDAFAKSIFGETRKTRFRCDFFPFVEPGAEMSIDCFKCDGEGCRVCSHTGWIEILGAGMVHPEVLRGVGYDPNIYSGFAFGMGAERIAMLRQGIDDIRHFYANDLRFLKQFSQQ